MNFAKSQKGMSAVGVMVGLALTAFFLSVGLKMFPHYMDNRALSGFIQQIEKDPSGNIHSIDGFYERIQKSMKVNAIRDIDLENVLEVAIVDNEFRAHLKYEKRENIIENLDLVARFDKEFRVRMP